MNPRHPLIVALAGLSADARAFKDDAVHLLFDEARVLDGERPADPRAFSDRLARVLARVWGPCNGEQHSAGLQFAGFRDHRYRPH